MKLDEKLIPEVERLLNEEQDNTTQNCLKAIFLRLILLMKQINFVIGLIVQDQEVSIMEV
jgi:hypothetical protein